LGKGRLGGIGWLGRIGWLGGIGWLGWIARTGRLARLARRMGLGRNPLRRRTDRIEAWVSAGLLAVFLVGAPLSWTSVGRWVHQGGLREQRAQQSWHQTPAVLLEAAPPLPGYEFRLSWENTVTVPARWSGPDGQHRSGEVSAPLGSQPGQVVQVWVDGSGRATGPPLPGAELTRRVVGAEMLAPVALAVLLLLLAAAVRWLLNRRRLASWEAGWASIGPRWTRHR
jgi:hypothetical protein